MYADLCKLDAFILDFRSLNYSPEQIYSADECGLYYSDLPVLNDSKEYLTLMMCCNASGKHRLPLVLVNNVEDPACLQVVDETNKRRHIDKSTLPVRYTHSPKGWITLEIFEQWFHGEFVPKVRAHLASLNQEEKAILLIDNCPAHPMKLESADGKIKGKWHFFHILDSRVKVNQFLLKLELLQNKYRHKISSLIKEAKNNS